MFCQVNEQEGVLITSPADSEDSGGLQQQVVENFYRCAARIHSDFSKVKAKVSSQLVWCISVMMNDLVT